MSDETGALQSLLSEDRRIAPPPEFAEAAHVSDPAVYVPLLVIPVAVQWWSVWYPGAEPGGGGYVAQRMLAAKNEKNAIGATMLFNFAHYGMVEDLFEVCEELTEAIEDR